VLLSEMLSALLVAYTIEYDNEFEHAIPHRTATFGATGVEAFTSAAGKPVRRLWLTSMAMWSNFMRYIPPDGIPLRQVDGLPANRAGLERWGYISVRPDGTVKATTAGRYAQAAWRRLDGVIDQRWADRFGADVVADLTESLRLIAGQVGAGMPLYLPMVSFADGLRSSYPDLRDRDLPEPALTDLNLSTLLSRVLLAFTLDYESQVKIPLPTVANTLRVIPDDGIRLSEIHRAAGVSKEGVASTLGFLERHHCIEIAPDRSGRRGKSAWPTESGIKARDARPTRSARIEQSWQTRFGPTEISALRATAEHLLNVQAKDGEFTLAQGLHGYPDSWRNHAPYAAQTKAMLQNPAEHLPRHPMVLHRGGYPDGS
jgi:DNA-binding MarR family transcriptional regulator